MNYTTTENELLAVVFTLDKFQSYLIGSPNSGFLGVTCDKQVLREQIDNIIVVHILTKRGLDLFFNKVEGYDQGMCWIL